MEIKFEQIFDFQYQRALKLENSSYLEELTGLLARVASCIDDEQSYFFGDEYYIESHEGEPNSSYTRFIQDFKNSFDNGSSEKINIIRGRAGVGKSLFFEKGVQKLIRNHESSNDDYIYMGVDFKNIDNDKTVAVYKKWIFEELCKNAIDCIRMMGEKIYNSYHYSKGSI